MVEPKAAIVDIEMKKAAEKAADAKAIKVRLQLLTADVAAGFHKEVAYHALPSA